jgi:HAE1 family hydrophobic/amphiphilic exporter-1
MAFFPGEGAEMVGPIGKTVLGGLSFGTLMTLFLTPAVYYIVNRRGDERSARAEARRQRIAEGISRKQAKQQNTLTGAARSFLPDQPQTEGAGL